MRSIAAKQNLILLALSLWSGVSSFFTPFVHTDEGAWAVLSKYLFSGEVYQSFTDHKPPLLFLFHWIFSFGENSLYALHICTALWLGLGAIALYFILKKFLTDRAAFLAACLFAILSGLIESGAFLPERLYVPASIFMIAATLKSLDARTTLQKIFWIFLAGICFGASACLKQPALMFGLIPLFILLRERAAIFTSIVVALLGAASITYLSWAILNVPFEVIWKESYLANFTYMSFNQTKASFQYVEIIKRVSAALLVLSMPVFFGAVRCLWKTIRSREAKISKESILLFVLIFSSVVIVSLGRRFYETYFIAALPCLSIMTVIYFNQTFVKRMLSLAIFISLWANLFYMGMIFSDRNKNWDSKIRKLVEEIRSDSSPEEKIWINHNLQSVYYAAERKPAVKYIFFQHSIGYSDPCTANDERLKENLLFPNYQTNLKMLSQNKPKVIFWTLRARNTCANRLQLQNFPSLQKFIDDSYTKKWENDLGVYYLRKS